MKALCLDVTMKNICVANYSTVDPEMSPFVGVPPLRIVDGIGTKADLCLAENTS